MPATIQTIHKPTRARGLDTSGNNNHAQIYSGRALEFDGVTDYLECFTTLDTTHSFFTTPNQFTVSCWVKVNTMGDDTVWYATNTANSSRVGLNIGAEGEISFTTYNGSSYVHASGGGSNEKIINASTWYRVVCTCDNNTLKLYLNGILQTGVSSANSGNMASTNGNRLRIGERNSIYFDGCLSDFQVWNSVFSQDDVTYDYLNPEQLVLNRGGTSLTNSNLKLWYPMNEGHRGNQSYVLDASNTGFNEAELLTNNSFDNGTTGWTLANPDDASVSASGGQLTLSIDAIDGTSGERNAYIRQTALVIGQRYRVTIDIAQDNTGIGIRAEAMGGTGYGTAESVGVTTFDITAVASTDIVFRMLNISSPSETGSIVVNSVSVQGINNKNNATTVFYGDDIVSNGTFDADTHWNKGTGWSIGSGVVSSDGSQSTWSALTNNLNGASNTVVVGRTYQITFDMTRSAGFIQVKTSGTHENHSSSGSKTTTFVADGTTWYFTANSDFVGTIDNVVLREVGVATGWTDADQQLDISQTALQSYNQLGWFDGVERLQSGSNITPGDHTSVSLWFFRNKGTSSETMALIEAGDYADDNFYIFHKGDSINIMTFNEDDSTTVQTHSISATINNGQWYHLGVYIPAANGGTVIAYLNGESIGTSTMSHPMKKTAYAWYVGYAGGLTYEYTEGGITEISYFNDQLTASEFGELYNNGLALNALEHSQTANLVHYWRNDGLTTWTDLKGSNNLTGSMTQSMLITAGVDSSRDSQGFLMNRQRLTNSLNFPKGGSKGDAPVYDEAAVVQDSSTLDITGDFTISFWVKFKEHATSSTRYNLIMKKTTWYGNGFGIHQHTGKSMLAEYAYNGSSGNQQYSSGGNSIDTLDVWYHVCFTHEDSVKDAWYVTKSTSTTLTTTATNETAGSDGAVLPSVGTNDYPLVIGQGVGGGQASSTDDIFPGEIDDVCIYNGKALEADEVFRNFKAGKRSHR